MILFHDLGYRCLKHFYLEKVCKHLCNLFPQVVSYNRFVELEKALGALAAYCLFPKKPTITVERTIDRQLTLF